MSGSPGRSSRLLVAIGTRPEAVKLAPVVQQLRARGRDVHVVTTGQHRELASDVLAWFGVRVDRDLDVMMATQTPAAVGARMLAGMAAVLDELEPALVVIQGDTSTVLATALAAFYARVPVAHVEAGLRSGSRSAPFPEEVHRRVASLVADLHFAPTTGARGALLAEGVPADRVVVTGNPVVDALVAVRDRLDVDRFRAPAGRRRVLVTVHRRESFGQPLREVCRAVDELARSAAVSVLWPVHPNPAVREAVHAEVGAVDGVELVEPLGYAEFLAALAAADVVLTDSGGVQEEAPSLGTPALVLRDVTERPEGVAAGVATLVGRDAARIVDATRRALDAPPPEATARNPYGDGRASERIADAIDAFLSRASRARTAEA